MGSWGTGLYADDFALDLRSDIAGIARLPVDGDEILALLRSSYGELAEDPRSEEYPRFWLVLADQFQRRGIDCPVVTGKALDLIDGGADYGTHAALGMPENALRKRAAVVAELRARLLAGPSSRRRSTLSKPQKLIMHPGEVFAYPTSGGEPFNPYITPAIEKLYKWNQDGWAALLILKSEIAYGYLAWYCPLVVRREIREKPTLESLANEPWTRRNPGTCSPSHFKRLRLEPLGQVTLGVEALSRIACSSEEGAKAALEDAPIVSWMDVASEHPIGNVWIQRQFDVMPAIRMTELSPTDASANG